MFTTEEAAYAMLGSGILGTIMGVFGTLSAVWYVFQIISNWKIFTKAGEKGWKSIIPFYNIYTQYKLTWKVNMFWVMLALVVAAGVCWTIESTVTSFLYCAVYIAMIVVTAMGYSKLAKSFGHGNGFAVGLLLFYPIFSLILAFGKSEYIGNTCEAGDNMVSQ